MNEKVAKVLRREIRLGFPNHSELALRKLYQTAKRKIKRGELTIATIKQRTVQA